MMLSWLAAAVSIFRPIDFQPEMPTVAFTRGQEIFAKKEPQSRTLQGSREVLGRWFDGRVRQEADYAVWMSPDALAAWYGYVGSRDVWTKAQVQQRWQQAETDLKGKLIFLVHVAAFPREDPLDFGTGKDADPAVLNNLQFRLSYKQDKPRYAKKGPETDGEFVLQPDGSYASAKHGNLEASIEKREAGDILNQTFFHLSSLSKYFLADGEVDDPDDGVPLGDYYGAVYRVEYQLPKTIAFCKSMKLEVIRLHKTATVNFGLMEPQPELVKADPFAHSRAISGGGAQ